MKKSILFSQLKRELWENKVSFINTPVIISVFIMVMALIATLYSGHLIYKHGEDFNFSATYSSSDGASIQTEKKSIDSDAASKNKLNPQNLIAVITSDPSAFNGFVLGVMYTNCVLLLLVFSIVLGAYSLRCLFDDRKNKDILFWRSMPVSETTNVLVKLGMLLVIAPLVIMVLNFIVTLFAFLMGLVFLGVNGVELGYLLTSVTRGGAFYIPFQIFYELLFSLLMLMPIIGFAFFASAFAKKTPFFTFIGPVVLVLADRIIYKVFSVNIGIVDIFMVYVRAITNVRAAFMLQESFAFHSSMILPFVICVGVGALFVAGAIWLRNNRYEI